MILLKRGQSRGDTRGKRRTCRGKIYKKLVKKWWDIYEDESLDYKAMMMPRTTPAAAAATDDGALSMELLTNLQRLIAGMDLQYVTAPSAA